MIAIWIILFGLIGVVLVLLMNWWLTGTTYSDDIYGASLMDVEDKE